MLELLKKFVSQNDPREYMRAPFSRGEWTLQRTGISPFVFRKSMASQHWLKSTSISWRAYSNQLAAMTLSPCRHCRRRKNARCATVLARRMSARRMSAQSATGRASLSTEHTHTGAKSATAMARSNTAARACPSAGIAAALAQSGLCRCRSAAHILTCFTCT